MVDNSAFKSYAAISSLYLALDQRSNQPFLERNLQKVLTSFIQPARPPGASNLNFSKGGGESAMPEPHAPAWDYPPVETLQNLVNGANLDISLRGLRLKSAKQLPKTMHVTTDLPDWIPNHRYELKIPCNIKIQIRGQDRTSKASIRVQSLAGSIYGVLDDHGNMQFILEMERFSVAVQKLYVILDSGRNGSRKWKQTATVLYVIDIFISCMESQHAAKLLSLLDDDVSPEDHVPADEATLKMCWSNLPACPSKGSVLDVWRTVDGKRRMLQRHGLEVVMEWRSLGATPLAKYNQMLQASQSQQRPAPRTSTALVLKRDVEAVEVKYIFQKGAQVNCQKVRGYSCIFCRSRLYDSVQLLQFHLVTSHDRLRFMLESAAEHTDSTTTPQRHIFWVEINERQSDTRASNHVSDEREFAFVKPDLPFDPNIYFKGNNSWTQSGLHKFGAFCELGRKVEHPKHRDTTSRTVPKTKPRANNPAEVPDMPVARKEKFLVPPPPLAGHRYYRTKSRRAVEEGELLSESDEEMEQDWFILRETQVIKRLLDLPAAVREALVMFNTSTYREELSDNLHAGDAMIRSVRSQLGLLRSSTTLRGEFLTKIQELHDDGVIGKQVLEYCRELLHGNEFLDTVAPSNAVSGRATPLTNGTPQAKPDASRQHLLNGVRHANKENHTPKNESPQKDHDGDIAMNDVTPGAQEEGRDAEESSSTTRKRRRYMPGGSGGGGRYVEVDGVIKPKSSQLPAPTPPMTNGHMSPKPTTQTPIKRSTAQQTAATYTVSQDDNDERLHAAQLPHAVRRDGETCARLALQGLYQLKSIKCVEHHYRQTAIGDDEWQAYITSRSEVRGDDSR
ncbi:hypothetical protein LTR66_009355 [Elasticomyces elasticus]|nr:hypothetical protein LTR66_009355 [Elasticomyces elasticus]